MSIPKILTILGRKWQVEILDYHEGDEDCFGETHSTASTISLYTAPHTRYPIRGSMQATLFHECLHAALATTGLDEILTDKVEETVVTTIEQALWPLIEGGVFASRPNRARKGKRSK